MRTSLVLKLTVAVATVALSCVVPTFCLAAPAKPPEAAQAVKPAARPAARAAQTQELRDKWAVLIGINEFQDPSIPKLRFGAKNVQDLQALLKDPLVGRFASDHVLSLTGKAATKAGIQEAILNGWLAKKALPADLIVIYLCTRVNADKDDVQLCAYDTLASEAKLSGISLAELLSELKRRTQAHHILVIADTSPVTQDTAAPEAGLTPQQLAAATGVSLLAAGLFAQPSYESSAAMGSYFAHYLAEGLKAGRGLLPLSSVSDYIVQNVKSDVARTLGKEQTPVLVLCPGSSDLARVALGVVVKSSTAHKVAIGHPLDDLAIKRPDLAHPGAAAHRGIMPFDPSEEDDEGAGNNVDFGTYIARVKQAIQRNWHPPKGFENRRIVTLFTILRDGTILNPTILEGSGLESVDKSALEALKESSPVDPLPLGAPRSVQIRYQFDWRVNRN